jgi:hypothetical protein
VHKIVKHNGQNIEYNSISGCEVWVAKEKIKIMFRSGKFADGIENVKTKGRTNKIINELSFLDYVG